MKYEKGIQKSGGLIERGDYSRFVNNSKMSDRPPRCMTLLFLFLCTGSYRVTDRPLCHYCVTLGDSDLYPYLTLFYGWSRHTPIPLPPPRLTPYEEYPRIHILPRIFYLCSVGSFLPFFLVITCQILMSGRTHKELCIKSEERR